MGSCRTEIEMSSAELPGGDIGFQMGKKLSVVNEGNGRHLQDRSEAYNAETLVSGSKEGSSDSVNDMRLVLAKKRVNFLPFCEVIPLKIERTLIPSSLDRFPTFNDMESWKIEAYNTELPYGDILSRREKKLLVKKKRSTENETCCVKVPIAEAREDSSSLNIDFISSTKRVTFLPSCEIIPLESENNDTRISDRLLNSNNREVCKIQIKKHNAEMPDGDIDLQIEKKLVINKGIVRSLENKNETSSAGAPIAELSGATSDSENDIDLNLTKNRNNFLSSVETVPVESVVNFNQGSSGKLPNSYNAEVCTELPHGDILSQKEKKLLDISKGGVRSPRKESEAYNSEVPIAEISEGTSDSENNDFPLAKKRVKFHPSCEIIPLECESNAIQISSDRQPNFDSMEDCEVEIEVLNAKLPGDNCGFQMEKQPSTKNEANAGSPGKDRRACRVAGPGVETHEDSSDLETDIDFIFTKKKKKKRVKFVPSNDNIPLYSEISVAQSSFKTQISDKYLVDTKNDYTYDHLLTRVFDKLRERNPNLDEEVKKKLIMKPPQVIRAGAKKTSFVNFLDICKLLHRTPQHLQSFLLIELGTNGSVDGNSQLVIKGKFQQKQIENVLRRYIREYVTCHTCHSPDTLLQRDTRLFFLQCEACGSRCSVASIKSGFQAVVNKRAATRAKAV